MSLTAVKDSIAQTISFFRNFYSGSKPYIMKVFSFYIFRKCVGVFFGSTAKIQHLNTVYTIDKRVICLPH